MLAAAQKPQCTCEYMRTPSTAQRCTGRTSAAGAWMRKSGRSNWVAQQVTRGSCRSVQHAMRLDITGGNADGDKDEQGNRYRDAPGQRLHRAAALTLCGHPVVQAGTEVATSEERQGGKE